MNLLQRIKDRFFLILNFQKNNDMENSSFLSSFEHGVVMNKFNLKNTKINHFNLTNMLIINHTKSHRFRRIANDKY